MIDEVTNISAPSMLFLEKFLTAKNIQGICAGDFN
jgi:hypothetical protein